MISHAWRKMKKTRKRKMRHETTESFLAGGGKITKKPARLMSSVVKYIRPKYSYDNVFPGGPYLGFFNA